MGRSSRIGGRRVRLGGAIHHCTKERRNKKFQVGVVGYYRYTLSCCTFNFVSVSQRNKEGNGGNGVVGYGYEGEDGSVVWVFYRTPLPPSRHRP